MIEAVFVIMAIGSAVMNASHETCVKNEIGQCVRLEDGIVLGGDKK